MRCIVLRKLIFRSCFAVNLLFGSAQLATTASAALRVYDPFSIGIGPGDYQAGVDGDTQDPGLLPVQPIGSSNQAAPFPGQNPATGPGFYAGGWTQHSNAVQVVEQGSLRYPRFPFAGGHVTDDVLYSCCTYGRNGREVAGFGLGGGRDALTIYQSFLVDFGGLGTDTDPLTDADPNNNGNIGKHGVEWWNGGIGDENLSVDLNINHFAGKFDLTLDLYTAPPGPGRVPEASAPLNGGGLTLEALAGTHLVVMKFEFDPTLADIVSVYLDPTDSIESNWAPAASIAVNSSDLIITHHGLHSHFQFTGGGHEPGAFDELRWGDTFADVTPFVPEPSSLTLLLVSMASSSLWRRRAGRKRVHHP